MLITSPFSNKMLDLVFDDVREMRKESEGINLQRIDSMSFQFAL